MVHLPACSAMIGREDDLRDLRTLFAESAKGRARAVVVAGEAGIGKTRLLQEFTAGAADTARVLSGQCVDLGAVATPYSPITALLRTLADQVGADAVIEAAGPGWESLGVLLPELVGSGAPGASENRLHEVVARLFEHFAAERPLIVVIEDLHWADDATLTVLRFLLRAVADGPIMIVLSYRSDDVHRGHPLRDFLSEIERGRRAQRLTLHRLTRDQVGEQAHEILGQLPPYELVENVYERSEGVPFFVEELVGLDGSGDNSMLPDTLRDLLLARYERLDESTQYLLRLMSAGGVSVSHELVASVFDRDPAEFDDAARKAVLANVLIASDNGYHFRHALVREAIHGDLLPGERTRFHTRYAEALESRPDKSGNLTEVAYHWDTANKPREAFPAALAAMSSAMETYAYMTAARMGERALEIWDHLDDAAAIAGVAKFELMASTSLAFNLAGEMDRALATINLALAQDDATGTALARLMRSKSRILAHLAKPGSIELLENALVLVPEGVDERLRATLLNRLAARFMIEARLAEAIDAATQGLEIALRIGHARESSIASNVRGVSRAGAGDVFGGLEDLVRARELADGNTEALLRFRVNYSDTLHLLGRYDESVNVAEEGIRRARELGVERTSGAVLASNAIEPLFALGEWERAGKLLDKVMSLAPPLTFRVYLFRATVWSALWRGDIDQAERNFRHWRPHMLALAEVEVQTRLQYIGLATELALARGDVASAWGHVAYLVSDYFHSLPGYDLPILANAARTLAALRVDNIIGVDIDEAEKQLRRVLETDAFWPTSAQWAALFDAEVGGADRTGTDAAAWSRALTESESLPANVRPYILMRLGMAQVDAGDRADSVAQLRAAVDSADVLGAGLITAQTRAFASRAGLPIDDTVGAKRLAANSIDLTTRERQVLDLIARGLTNRQIGEELFISAKTASVHVSAILRKLGASSRTEAATMTSHS